MEVFPGGWEHYMQRLEENWRRCRAAGRLGGVARGHFVGDVLAGNFAGLCVFAHASRKKDSSQRQPRLLVDDHGEDGAFFFAEQGWNDFAFLHNNCVMHDGVALCGTRSWMFDASVPPQDEKVMARECGRLRMSLQAAGG